VRKFEREKKIDVISKQYKPAEEPAAPALWPQNDSKNTIITEIFRYFVNI
jgi:hypothetical protein